MLIMVMMGEEVEAVGVASHRGKIYFRHRRHLRGAFHLNNNISCMTRCDKQTRFFPHLIHDHNTFSTMQPLSRLFPCFASDPQLCSPFVWI